MYTNTEVTEEMLDSLDFDICILATGAKPVVPGIPGLKESGVLLANDVLSGKHVLSGQKVLMIGGGLVGCECAEFLNVYGNTVDIVDMIPDFAPGLNKYPRAIMLNSLKAHQSRFYPETRVLEIRKDGIVGEKKGEKTELTGYEAIVLALDSRPFVPLKEKLEQSGKEFYVLGDAETVKDAKYAIFNAAKLALTL